MEAQQLSFLGMMEDPYLSCFYLAGQISRERQRRGRYLQGDPNRHPATMLPEMARSILMECSRPGERIIVPMSGIGTEQIEAAWLGIDSVGFELESHWTRQNRLNLAHNWALGAPGVALLNQGDARQLSRTAQGPFDGALWSPPYVTMLRQHTSARDKQARAARMAAAGHEVKPITMGGPRSQNAQGTYRSADPASNLGYMSLEQYQAALQAVMVQLYQVVRPGGWQAVVVKDVRLDGRPLVLFPIVIAAAEAAGWSYEYRRTALMYRVNEDGRILERASQFQRLEAKQTGRPLPVAEDVVFFRRA